VADTSVIVDIGAKVDGLEAGVAQAKSSLESLGGSASELTTAFHGLLAAVGGAFAIDKIEQFIDAMTNLNIQMERAKSMIGLPTESFAGLNLAAESVGGTMQMLEMGIGRMNLKLAQAEAGTKTAKAGFDALGLSVKDLINLPADQQILKIANAFSVLKDGPQKAAIAIETLSRAGITLLPIFNQGAAAIQKFMEMTDRAGTGGARNKDALDQFAAAAHSVHLAGLEVEESWRGVGETLTTGIAPGLIALKNTFSGLLESINNNIKAGGVFKTIMQDIDYFFIGLAAIVAAGNAAMQAFWEGIKLGAATASNDFTALKNIISQAFKDPLPFVDAMGKTLIAMAVEVGKAFVDLGLIITKALTLDFSGAKRAFDDLVAADHDAAGKIRAAWSGVSSDISNIWADAQQKNRAASADGALRIKEISNQLNADLTRIANTQADKEVQIAQTKNARLRIESGQATKDAMAEAQRQIGIINQQYEIQSDAIKAQYKNVKDFFGVIESQKTAQLIAAINQRQSAELAVLQNIEDHYKLTVAERQKIEDEKTKIVLKATLDRQKAEEAATASITKTWNKMADDISSSFNSQLRGLLDGTTTFTAAIGRMLGDLIIKFISDIDKWAVEWMMQQLRVTIFGQTQTAAQVATTTAGEVSKTAATTTGVGARTTTETGGFSLLKVFGLTDTSTHAASEAAKTAATVAGASTRTTITISKEGVITVLKTSDVATHTAAETSKTAATTTGVVARSSQETSAATINRTIDSSDVATHTTAETAKTTATTTGTTARTATETSGFNILKMFGLTDVSTHTASEAAKTVSTTTGVTARTTTETGGVGALQALGLTSTTAHAATETTKTAATGIGVASRQTIEGGEFVTSKTLEGADVTTFISGEAAKTAAATGGTAARTTAASAGTLASMGTYVADAMAAIGAAVAKIFAQLTAFLVPVFGPAAPAAALALALGVGVGAVAMIHKFDTGTDYVMNSGLAMIHAGEQIVPAQGSGPYTGAANSNNSAINANFQIQAWDARSVQNWLSTGGAKVLANAVSTLQNRNPSTRPVY
jgi:hypothetical protein